MKLITYECEGKKHYDTCEDVIQWLRHVNHYTDGPYLILNVIEVSDVNDVEFCQNELNGI